MDFLGEPYTNIAIVAVILIVAYFAYTYFAKTNTTQEPIQEDYFETMQPQQCSGDSCNINEGFEEPFIESMEQ